METLIVVAIALLAIAMLILANALARLRRDFDNFVRYEINRALHGPRDSHG